LLDVSPLAFLAARFWLAFIALVLMVSHRLVRVERKAWLDGCLLGIVLFGAYAFYTVGLQYTTVVKASFVNGLFVIFVPMLSMAVERRLASRRVWIGATFSVAGVGLLTLNHDWSIAYGDALILLCALLVAAHILLVDYLTPGRDPLGIGVAQVGMVAFLSTAAVPFEGPLPSHLSVRALSSIGYNGLIATALALLIQVVFQRCTTPARTALIFVLEPVFALLLAVLILGERPELHELLGCGLILAGVISGDERRASRDHAESRRQSA
jgi:drug/metabolite transporter (DMT)-like permease